MSMRRFIAPLLCCALFFAVAMAPTPAHAQLTQPWNGVCVDDSNSDVATLQGIQCLVGNMLTIAISGVGFVGFVMMIVGSFRYLLSGGNSKGTESGKNTFTYAVVGLVVALMSFMAIQVISAFTGVQTILQFKIPNSETNWAEILNGPPGGGGRKK